MSSSEVATPTESLKRTPLYALHQALGARLAPFAGWDLPLYYSSILEEHRAVRTGVGVFDVSHLGHLEVSGEGCLPQLQLLFTQDLNAVEPGAACYSPMLNPKGWILDEMIFYRLEPNRFRLVVNAANGDKVLGWLKSRLHPETTVEDLRERFGTLALQGPKAASLLAQVSPLILSTLPRYRITRSEAAGKPVWVARTGYTGEDGCELFVRSEDLPEVWQTLLEKGKPVGIQPIGLGARDTLRLEAGLPLGGSDLDEKTTPLEAGLDWTVEWRKGPFVGREALERQRREGVARRLVGFELKAPGIPRPGYAIFQGEEKVGRVTSGTFLPAPEGPAGSGRAIGMGYVPPQLAKPGTRVWVEVHQRKVEAEVVRLPFYRRPKS